jgi:short-subunit dehydrogenase
VTRINRELLESGLTVAWLVNNAGTWLAGAICDSRPEDLEAALSTNVVAAHRLTRAVLPGMLERGIGAILNVGSLAGMAPAPGFALYAASKAFLHDMTIALREELRDTGIVDQPSHGKARFQQLPVDAGHSIGIGNIEGK